uniref:Uncharacterized protein n=1 Tax=Gasterosteus aculeatus aculeatus TaxID=481459 RepID=A0AAQ4S7Q5_GASAC
KPDSEPTGLPESEPECRVAAPPQRSEEKKPEGHPQATEQPTSATTDSDSKTLSSAESSEDEEEAKEVPANEGEAVSILPSSVLDKAGAIAQHFSSVKRGAPAPDEGHSLGCGSPRLRSRTGSLSAEPAVRMSLLNSFCTDPSEVFSTTDLTLLSPQEDVLLDVDGGIRRRRDSALSKQDQLLIGKIRSYYENAESEDAAFGLQRRESLTYIPTGLVRSSVSRLNSIPKDEADLEDIRWSRSHSLQENPSDDEEFRPSSEMIKVWQTMEREISQSQGNVGGLPRSKEVPSETKVIPPDTAETSSSSCHREKSVSPSPLQLRSSTVSRTGSLKEMLKVFGEEGISLRAPVLRVPRLKSKEESVGEDSDRLDDVDAKSKVLNLARQYSQRIKTTKPMVRQRIPGVLVGGRTLTCVEEEKQAAGFDIFEIWEHICFKFDVLSSAGKPNIPHNPTTSLPPNPVDPTPPAKLGRARSRSPLTPLGAHPPTECFNWPDVRELRSRYSDQDRPQQGPVGPVGRSLSIPEQLCDGGLRRRSSCSSDLLLAKGASQERDDGYYVAAEAALPGDEEHKILVMEKLSDSQSPVAEDDYSSGRQDDEPKAGGSNPRAKTEAGQKSVVKNLREKFQSRS